MRNAQRIVDPTPQNPALFAKELRWASASHELTEAEAHRLLAQASLLIEALTGTGRVVQ